MHNLFIIGNGFDLAHGLKTSYAHFMEDLIKKVIKKPTEYKDIAFENLNKNIVIDDPFGVRKDVGRIFKLPFLDFLYTIYSVLLNLT
jgi:hypothetical protein